MTTEVGCVVVTHNSADHLSRCLELLDGLPVVVVDNASRDDSLEIARRFDNVRATAMERNVGLAKATQIGASHVAAEHHLLLLNPDAEARRSDVERLVRCVREDSRIGVVVPRLVFPDGTPQVSIRRFPSAKRLVERQVGRLAKDNPTDDDLVGKDQNLVDDAWALGAAMLITPKCRAMVGTFDPSFFLYGEDVDLCMRVQHAGFVIRYAADVEIAHHYGQASRRIWRLQDRAVRAHWTSILRLALRYPRLFLLGR